MIGFIVGLILGFFLAVKVCTFDKEDFYKLPEPVKEWIIKKIK